MFKTPPSTRPLAACVLVGILYASAGISRAVVVADLGGDWVDAATLPAGYSYLQSDAATGGTEVALSPSQAIGNAGATGFGGGGNFNMAAVLGDNANGGDYQIFADGQVNHGGVVGTDLLVHPRNVAAGQYVIVRYTISAADLSFGITATITGGFQGSLGGRIGSVYHNSTALYTSADATPDRTTTGAFNVSAIVSAGDTISFVLDSQGNYGGDETSLRATISLESGAAPDFVTVGRGNSVIIDVLANDVGIVPDLSTMQIISGATYGTTQVNPDGSITYTAPVTTETSDSFVYQFADTGGEIFDASVSISIVAPVPVPDSHQATYSTTTNLAVLANDQLLVEGGADLSTLRVSSAPSSGMATVQPNGTIDYEETSGSAGTDSFMYAFDNLAGNVTYATTVDLTFTNGLKLVNSTLNFPAVAPTGGYQFIDAFPGLTFSQATGLEVRPGDSQRLFVGQRGGQIWLIPDVTAATPTKSLFLDLSGQTGTGGFSGLRGFAFHPDFATNRYFFVGYKDSSGNTKVSRFQADAGNLDSASAATETVLFSQGNYSIHGINRLIFGPDGYLYIACGDQGNGAEATNSQRIDLDWWSTVSRIDVDKLPGNYEPAHTGGVNLDGMGKAYYSIPADNPFVDQVAADGRGVTTLSGQAIPSGDPWRVRTEIYALGFRNPWKIGFVPGTSDLWVSDVGHGSYDKYCVMPKGGNAGWGHFQGTDPWNIPGDPPAGNWFTQPVIEYKNPANGATGGIKSIIGGVFYESNAIAELSGAFIFCDFTKGDVWYMKRPDHSAHQVVGRVPDGGDFAMDETGMQTELISVGSNFEAKSYNVSSIVRIGTEFGINAMILDPSGSGNVLMNDYGDGIIRKLVYNPNDGSLPQTLTDTGAFSNLASLTPEAGISPYDINLSFWSDNAIKSRYFSLDSLSDTIGYSQEGPWGFPAGSVFVKHFEMDLDRDNPGTNRKRLETRFIVVTDDDFYGVSYQWNDTGTEAFLVPSEGVNLDLNIIENSSPVVQTWRIPSRGECRACHTPDRGPTLGFDTRQLNLSGTLNGVSGNFLDLLRDAGYFTEMTDQSGDLPRHYRPDETAENLEERVRSYLAVNCSYCHYEGNNSVPDSWSGESSLTIEQTNLLHGVALGAAVADPTDRLIIPGNIAKSMILSRAAGTNGYGRMPPLATNVVDAEGVALLIDWINNYANAKPVITNTPGPHPVTENSAALTFIGAGPTATDADAPDVTRSTLTWSILSGNGSGYFDINPTNGDISLATIGPDFEEGASQVLTVQVSDNYAPNPGSATADVEVQVSDILNDDTQGDGIIDEWAVSNLGMSLIDPLGDTDGDRSNELFEFWANSDPSDPKSRGVFHEASAWDGTPGSEGFLFEWVIRTDRIMGTDYKVQGSGTLLNFTNLDAVTDFTIESNDPIDAVRSRIQIKVPAATGDRYFFRLSAP